MTPPRLSARNGSSPVAANTVIAPQANTSAGAPARCPVNTSGAMYVGVPATSPVLVSDMSRVRATQESITRGLQNDATRRAAVASLANRSRLAGLSTEWRALSATRRPSRS